jgi:Heterokaryon incompatibility protein (HET)
MFRGLEKYRYGEVELASEGSFRLLILAPGRGRDALKARLVLVNIENPLPAYEALSYAWGSPRRSRRLLIESQTVGESRTFQIPVTSNLQRALKALRDADDRRILWVDAVCINQEDVEERNNQVAIMEQIYRKAFRTVVYLGEDFPFCRQLGLYMPAVELFISLERSSGQVQGPAIAQEIMDHGPTYTIITTFFSLFQHTWFKPFSREWFASFRRVVFTMRNARQTWQTWGILHNWWRAWIHVFSQSYFRRCWAVQELVVSRSLQIQFGKTVLCGGDSAMGFDEFEAFILKMLRHGPAVEPRKRPKYIAYSSQIKSFVHTSNLRTAYHQSRWASLLMLLTRLGDYDSSDPRDQLYAFLGISEDTYQPSLMPAYNENLRDTFCRYAKFFSTRYNCMQLLYDFRCGHTVPNLPSWIPNWVAPLDIDNARIPWLTYLEEVDGPSSTHSSVYYASGYSTASMRVDDDDDDDAITKLSIKGVIVDDIFHVGSVFIAPEKLAKMDTAKQGLLLLNFYNEIDHIATLRHVHVPESQFLEEAKWRTLKSDCSEYEASELRVHISDHQLEKAALQNKTITDLGPWHQRSIDRISETRMGLWQVYRNRSYDSKKLCLTDRGYLGQVPHSARIGDKVCIFLGSNVPHVIRPVDGGFFRLLGTAYIHGIMQGEAMEAEESVNVRELVLV